jgi:hypothetical protein
MKNIWIYVFYDKYLNLRFLWQIFEKKQWFLETYLKKDVEKQSKIVLTFHFFFL